MNPISINTDVQCLVFKTNVHDELKASRLSYILERTDGVCNWNLDMEDPDRVLRLEFSELNEKRLFVDLFRFKIQIEELPIW
jgi:hypothetical protein